MNKQQRIEKLNKKIEHLNRLISDGQWNDLVPAAKVMAWRAEHRKLCLLRRDAKNLPELSTRLRNRFNCSQWADRNKRH